MFYCYVYLHSNLYFVMTFMTNLFRTRPVIPDCGGEASVLMTGIDLFITLLHLFFVIDFRQNHKARSNRCVTASSNHLTAINSSGHKNAWAFK